MYPCKVCGKSFLYSSSLTKHGRHCGPSREVHVVHPTSITSNASNLEIIEAIADQRLKWKCAQRLGTFCEKLFPLVFIPDNVDVEPFKDILSCLPSTQQSEDILEGILAAEKAEPIILNKNISLLLNGKMHNLTSFSIPLSQKFKVIQHVSYVTVELQNNQEIEFIAEGNPSDHEDGGEDEPMGAPPPAPGPDDDDGEDPSDDEGGPPPPPPPPPPPGGDGGPPDGNDDGHDENGNPAANPPNYFDQVAAMRSGQGLGRGNQTNDYPGRIGQGGLSYAFTTYSAARNRMLFGSKTVHQYANLLHIPQIMTDAELNRLTGYTRQTFAQYQTDIPCVTVRERKLSKEAVLLLYFEKLRHNNSFDTMGVHRNMDEMAVIRQFNKCLAAQYLHDQSVPLRNNPVAFEMRPVNDILREHATDSDYVRGIFGTIVPNGNDIVLLNVDATYGYSPKFESPRAQNRTYCAFKKNHNLKTNVVTDHMGKVIAYSPMMGSMTPDLGDGNMETFMLQLELDGKVKDTLNAMLRPTDPTLSVFSFHDFGYVNTTNANDRGTNLTMHDYMYDQDRDGYNENSRFFAPTKVGGPILGADLRPAQNPTPAVLRYVGEGRNRKPVYRTKKTTSEAACDRTVTKFRKGVEQFFGVTRQYGILNERIGHTSQYDQSSLLEEECPDIPKMELLWNAVFCNINRNHRFFEEKWQLPTGMTWFTMGQNFFMRIFLQNEFDTYTFFDGAAREIDWDVKFKPMPHGRGRNLGGWQPLQLGAPEIQFPRIAQADLTMLTHGSYQIDNAHKYATAAREQEVLPMVRNVTIPWLDFHALSSTLPQDKKVFIYDQINRPNNWSDADYGVWFARRLLLIELPSLHKADQHLVVLSYVPDDPVWNERVPQDLPNRLGFIQEGLKNLVGYACLRDTCPIGLRLLGCCSHVATAVMLLGVFSHDPDAFCSKHKLINYLDFRLPESLNVAMFHPPEHENNVELNEQEPPQEDPIVHE